MNRFSISTRLLFALVLALTLHPRGVCSPQSDAAKPIRGEGVIDRVVSPGSEPVFRADGYTFRIVASTDVHFGKGLQALNEVETNTWAAFEGSPDNSGTIVASKAVFIKQKPPRGKPDPNAVQVTAIPRGSKIDSYNGFTPHPKSFLPEDRGGWCGWYYIPDDPLQQDHVRILGQRLIPQYQRDLPDGDPAKIPFRFYLVQETEIRSAIFCYNGLILIPSEVVSRLHNNDQLAEVLAYGIAGAIQKQTASTHGINWKEFAELMPGVALANIGGIIPLALGSAMETTAQYKISRDLEHKIDRIALSYLADAGFDPHQAPEAWRVLAPETLPKNPLKLKYPEHSQYLQNFLKTQYNSTPGSKNAETNPATPASPASP